jgi:hypothetical protein
MCGNTESRARLKMTMEIPYVARFRGAVCRDAGPCPACRLSTPP